MKHPWVDESYRSAPYSLKEGQIGGKPSPFLAETRTLLSQPLIILSQVIMYDEPTAGLDPVASTVVEDLIRSMHVADMKQRFLEGRGGGGADLNAGGIASYIVVTHQHSTIRRSVDRLIFLHEVVHFVCCRKGFSCGNFETERFVCI